MIITYKSDVIPATGVIVDLYNSSGINRSTTDYKSTRSAMENYPKVRLDKVENGFIIKRTS